MINKDWNEFEMVGSYPKIRPTEAVDVNEIADLKEEKIEDVKNRLVDDSFSAICLKNQDDDSLCKVLYLFNKNDGNTEKMVAERNPGLLLVI